MLSILITETHIFMVNNIVMESECIMLIEGKKIVGKIVWKGGSKFEIVECEDNNYVGTMIDASDVLRCIV